MGWGRVGYGRSDKLVDAVFDCQQEGVRVACDYEEGRVEVGECLLGCEDAEVEEQLLACQIEPVGGTGQKREFAVATLAGF